MKEFCITGNAHKFGNNINTDLISPAQYMELSYEEIGAHAMEGVVPNFSKIMKPGDIIVAGDNFGSGSSRETAPIALKQINVGAVIAGSFARIFYRNAINIGLPVLETAHTNRIAQGDKLVIYPLEGKIKNVTKDEEYPCTLYPERIMTLVRGGGLIPYVCERKNKEK